MKDKYSRRDFLKTAATASVVGGATLSLIGCSATDSSTATAPVETTAPVEPAAVVETAPAEVKPAWLPETWDYETDVLVIGYGGAGVWAALTAADEGKAEVLILEKAPVRGGGNSSINLGEFTTITDTEGAFKYVSSFTHGKTPEPVMRAWAAECARNTEYATRWNIPWKEQAGTLASGYKQNCEYPFLPGADAMHVAGIEGLGMGMWAVMDQNRVDQGIEVIWQANNEELIQNPDTKEIVGCYTYIGTDDQKKYAIKARKGVVMTIGGFEFNDDLKRDWLKVYPADGFYGWPFNTGDGIGMVTKVGAKLWHMDCMIGGGNFNAHDPDAPYAMGVRPKGNSYIQVNQQGKRWHNELSPSSPHVGWHVYEGFNESICDFDHTPTWVILDQAAVDAGCMGPKPGGDLSRGMYGANLPDEVYGAWGKNGGWSDDNSVEIEKGWILKGETVAELVQKINDHPYGSTWMTAETLQETIDTFNSDVNAGNDTAFGRDPEKMAALAAPFYAFPVFPGGCSTLGGPQKNELGQVVDWSDQPIQRLYAAGCFGNIAGHTYGISGGNNAENMIWGRICGRNCAGLDAWEA